MLKSFVLVALGFARLNLAVGVADDVCLTQTFPIAIGEDGDEDTVAYSIAMDTFSGGYWIGGRTDVPAIINGGSKSWFMKIDDNNQYVEGYSIKDDEGQGYVRVGSLAADDSSTTIVGNMLYRTAFFFYTPGGTSTMYKLRYNGSTLYDYEPGRSGFADPILF